MINLKRIDHITLTYPSGQKEEAFHFYSDVLQLPEIPGNHPNGAIWLKAGNIELHLVAESKGSPSARHPGFEVENLEEAKKHLQDQGVEITYSSKIEGRERCFFRDPFDNRIELLAYDR